MNQKELEMEELTRLLIEEEQLFEMSTITTRESGLKTKLNLIQDGEDRGYPHWARVKVKTKNSGLFPIILEPEVKPLNSNGQYTKLEKEDKKLVDEAIEYVKQNKDLILAYWKGQFEEDTLHDILNNRISLEDAIKQNKK